MTCCSTPTEVSPFTGGAALAWDGESWSPWSAEEARGCTCTSWLRVVPWSGLHVVQHHTMPAPQPISALDRPLRGRGVGRHRTLRALFASFRERGLLPHPLSAERDEAVASLLWRVHASATAETPEEGVVPVSCIGITEGAYPRETPVTSAGIAACGGGDGIPVTDTDGDGVADLLQDDVDAYGSYRQMVLEVAKMGAGRVRRVKASDIYYACLFPQAEVVDAYVYGAEVPTPANILAGLRGTLGAKGYQYEPFGAATALLLVAATAHVKVDLTPLNAGGGMEDRNHVYTNDIGDDEVIPLNAFPRPVTWADLRDGAPGWELGALTLSAAGWNDFYWNWDSASTAYQRFVLTVWPTGRVDGTLTSSYDQECRRRKCFAVVAYSTAVAEWLASLSASLGGPVTDVVDTIEYGNEFDGFFPIDGSGATPGKREGALAAGRYFALIAGPIAAQFPTMRFRIEVSSAPIQRPASPTDPFGERLSWLEAVFTEGMQAEVDRWGALSLSRHLLTLGLSIPSSHSDWFATEALTEICGVEWPPRSDAFPRTVGSMVHQVGFHWYHGYDRRDDGGPAVSGYADAAESAALVVRMSEMLATIARRIGATSRPGVTVGEIGFPAVDPFPGDGGHYYANTSEPLQAAMHVRLVTTLLAAGADSANVYTFNYGSACAQAVYPATGFVHNFANYTSMGVHNDLNYQASSADCDANPYRANLDGWPRAAWYALRRMSWLYAQTGADAGAPPTLTIVHARRGLFVIELTFVAPLSTGPDGASFTRPWTRGYLIWLDQYADSTELHSKGEIRTTRSANIEFAFGADDDVVTIAATPAYEILPIVPDRTTPPPDSSTADPETGYARPSASVDWSPAGWDSALTSARLVVFTPTGPFATPQQAYLTVTIAQCDPTSDVAVRPILLLTTGDFTREIWP